MILSPAPTAACVCRRRRSGLHLFAPVWPGVLALAVDLAAKRELTQAEALLTFHAGLQAPAVEVPLARLTRNA